MEPYADSIDDQINKLHNGRHVTNFSNKQLDLYRQALAEYNKTFLFEYSGLHIKDKAYDRLLRPLRNHSALIYCGWRPFNLTDFWDIFDRLKRQSED